MRHFFCAISLLLITACASNHIEKSSIILDSPTSITFKGSTSMSNADAFEALLLMHSPSITSLTINSRGGDVYGGLKIGHLVHDHNLDVTVRGFCASSCANYIVTAAKQVMIEENGLLGWHGGSTQNLYSPLKDNTSWLTQIWLFVSGVDVKKVWTEFFAEWQRQETSFFKKVQVKQAITIIGIMPEFIDKRDASLFSYDIDTLTKLGLNIQYENKTQNQNDSAGNKTVQTFTISDSQLKTLLENHQRNLTTSI